MHRKKVDLEIFFLFFPENTFVTERKRKNPILAWWSLSSANATATTTFKSDIEIREVVQNTHTHIYIDFFKAKKFYFVLFFFRSSETETKQNNEGKKSNLKLTIADFFPLFYLAVKWNEKTMKKQQHKIVISFPHHHHRTVFFIWLNDS